MWVGRIICFGWFATTAAKYPHCCLGCCGHWLGHPSAWRSSPRVSPSVSPVPPTPAQVNAPPSRASLGALCTGASRLLAPLSASPGMLWSGRLATPPRGSSSPWEPYLLSGPCQSSCLLLEPHSEPWSLLLGFLGLDLLSRSPPFIWPPQASFWVHILSGNLSGELPVTPGGHSLGRSSQSSLHRPVCCSAPSPLPPRAGVSALPPMGDGCLLVFTGLPRLPVQPSASWPPGLPTPYCEHICL